MGKLSISPCESLQARRSLALSTLGCFQSTQQVIHQIPPPRMLGYHLPHSCTQLCRAGVSLLGPLRCPLYLLTPCQLWSCDLSMLCMTRVQHAWSA